MDLRRWGKWSKEANRWVSYIINGYIPSKKKKKEANRKLAEQTEEGLPSPDDEPPAL